MHDVFALNTVNKWHAFLQVAMFLSLLVFCCE